MLFFKKLKIYTKKCIFNLYNTIVKRLYLIICVFLLLPFYQVCGQDITLFNQFNGRFDFIMIGNTLNTVENNGDSECSILTTSAANLNFNNNQIIEKAYLYWAGSGSGDFEITLNSTNITAERTFNFNNTNTNLTYFSAFSDITTLVQTTGNGSYVLSNLDLTNILLTDNFCNNRTNFGGWAMLIIYKDNVLPINQLNVYDGLQGVPTEINITLNSLNVIDNIGSKIGFLAWEGDQSLATESLKLNGIALSNAENPENNVFNGTNSFDGATNLYNMDMDVYAIDGNIAIGDQTAQISFASTRDFVMLNTIITKLNSQLPDATILIDRYQLSCDLNEIEIRFTVLNQNGTNFLPANVPIAFFADNVFLGSTNTMAVIDINQSETQTATFPLPETIVSDFELKMVVDQLQSGIGTVAELVETNNTNILTINKLLPPLFNNLNNIKVCNEGLGVGRFDFSNYENTVKTVSSHVASFYYSMADAISSENPILSILPIKIKTPQTIFVRIEDQNGCFSITNFEVETENCPPIIYNLVATKPDNHYDSFEIVGLRDVFLDFKLTIFNRWGRAVWSGNNNTDDWNGRSSLGFVPTETLLPDGTYYYHLELNDIKFPNPIYGFLYLLND